MAQKNAQQALQNWLNAMQSAQTAQNYSAGVDATQVNPMAQAAAHLDKYQAGVQQAVSSGRMASALQNTPVSTWKNNSKAKSGNLAVGARQSQAKAQAAYQKLQPIWQQMAAAAQGVQGTGLQAAQQKSAAALQVLMQGTGKA